MLRPFLKKADPGFLKLVAEAVTTDKRVQVEFDQTRRTYVHLLPGSLGTDLAAGFFTKKFGKQRLTTRLAAAAARVSHELQKPTSGGRLLQRLVIPLLPGIYR
jgi:hypothetical protein